MCRPVGADMRVCVGLSAPTCVCVSACRRRHACECRPVGADMRVCVGLSAPTCVCVSACRRRHACARRCSTHMGVCGCLCMFMTATGTWCCVKPARHFVETNVLQPQK